MAAPVVLQGFVYGEHLEGPQQRSLGFRLLTPAEPRPWAAEVEALARQLQGAPYPDQWPPAELFCSVLLADGQRLIALARYGLADHTASRRRSGLELLGVVGRGSLGVASALAIYQWLKQPGGARARLNGTVSLEEVLAAVPPQTPAGDPLPVLPIKIWQEGVLLFAATAPSDPDHRLGMLEQGPSSTWQWLPLVGADFPLATYAQRGPLVAWTPHLANVAVKLDGRGPGQVAAASRWPLFLTALTGAGLLLLAANLWATLVLTGRVQENRVPAANTPHAVPPTTLGGTAADRGLTSLYGALRTRGVITDANQASLLAAYENAVREDGDLRAASHEGKLVVGAVAQLSQRSPAQVEALVREALSDRGYDPELVNRACQLVREKFAKATDRK